jgi:hypothetical protein
VGAAVDAVPDGDAGGAGRCGEVLDRDAGFGGDVLEAPLPGLVLLAEPVRVDGVLAASGGPVGLARAVFPAGRLGELAVGRRLRSGRGRGAADGEAWREVTLGCEQDMVGGGGEPGGDGAGGEPGADERAQVAGADAVGVGAGPVDAGDPAGRGRSWSAPRESGG